MGLNYRKSITLGKGIKVNLSKSGPGISFGKNGLRFSVNSRGQVSGTVGIPGTGIYYNKRINVIDTIKKFFGGREEITQNDEVQVKNGMPLPQNTLDAEADYMEMMKSVHLNSDEEIDWNEVIRTQNTATPEGKNVRDLAEMVLKGDDNAYLTVIEEMRPFDDLSEFGTDFQVGILEDGLPGISFNINADETIPSEKKTLLKSGKISVKPMSMTMRNTLIRDYVSSVVIRAARDMFSLLPVESIVVNAEDKRLDKATGKDKEITILSVIFDRKTFMDLNFSKIEPFETIKIFKNNMDFKPTKGGFQEVLPIK